jgi:hypothetical protein
MGHYRKVFGRMPEPIAVNMVNASVLLSLPGGEARRTEGHV